MSVYPQIGLNTVQYSVNRGVVDDASEFVLPFQVARDIGPVWTFVEVGYTFIEHETDEWIYGLAGEYELVKDFKLLGEFHGVASSDLADDELVFNLGFKWQFHENVALMGSAGRSLREFEDEGKLIISYCGLQLTF